METKSLFVDVSVDKSSWGTAVDNGGIVNYVSEDGTTSAEITGNHMIYLKEESDGTSAWYAIDNSEGVFRSGSKLHVRWLNANENPEEMDKYYDMLDEKYRNASEQEKLWIFLVGVTDPDGEEYRQFEKSVPFYIELGEDWDKDDIKAVFISSESDEVLDVEYIDDFETPEGIRSVAKLTMHHFSPYAIFEDLLDDNADKVDLDGSVKNFLSNPSTGDNIAVYMVILASLTLIFGLIVIKRVYLQYYKKSSK